MRSFKKNLSGVTLLEVMLVLAVASLILLMGVRYYRSATASRQATDVLNNVQLIMTVADSFAAGSGTNSYTGVTTGGIQNVLPNSGTVPWGTGQYTVSNTTASTYTITVPAMPGDVCTLVTAKITGLTGFSVTGSCAASSTATSDFKYTYTNTLGY